MTLIWIKIVVNFMLSIKEIVPVFHVTLVKLNVM